MPSIVSGDYHMLTSMVDFCRLHCHRERGPVEGEKQYRNLTLSQAASLWNSHMRNPGLNRTKSTVVGS